MAAIDSEQAIRDCALEIIGLINAMARTARSCTKA